MLDWLRKIRRVPEGELCGAWRPCPDVRAVAAPDGLAVFDLEHGCVFRSNAVGAEIWREVVERQRGAAAVAGELAGRFGISAVQAREDVTRFVNQLREQKLVTAQ